MQTQNEIGSFSHRQAGTATAEDGGSAEIAGPSIAKAHAGACTLTIFDGRLR